MTATKKVSEAQFYTQLNFHPQGHIDRIHDWLADAARRPLVLRGNDGVGRGYLLQAACREQQLDGRPVRVVPLDWARLQAEDRGATLQTLLAEASDKDEAARETWQALLKEAAEISVTPSLPFLAGIEAVIKLLPAFELAYRLLPTFQLKMHDLSPGDEWEGLQWLLESLCKDQHIVLHIQHADQLTHLEAWRLIDLVESLDRDTAALPKKNRVRGWLYLAFSTTELSRKNDDGSPLGQLENPVEIRERRINRGQLQATLKRNFHPNLFDNGLAALWRGKSLSRWMRQVKSRHPLNTRLADLLFDYARWKEKSDECDPASVARGVGRLLDEQLLVSRDGIWQIAPDTSDAELDRLLGRPLREEAHKRLRQTPQAQQAALKLFLQLAALCHPDIPWRLLLRYVAQDQGQDPEALRTALLRFGFADEAGPALFETLPRQAEPERADWWRLTSPLLAFSQQGDDPVSQAHQLLQDLPPALPVDDRRHAPLYLRLAAWAGSEEQQQWRERLHWWIEEEHAHLLEEWLTGQLNTGRLRTEHLLQLLKAHLEIWPLARSGALLRAVQRHYDAADGIPWSMEGILFLNLYGLWFHQNGDLQEALPRLESGLSIIRSILPAGHLHIAAINLNNIGRVLNTMGEHQAALDKYEEALAIKRQALPAGHPDIAISFNNIGSVLSDMGEHQAALEKHEEALAIRRQALPAGHPDIATSLNNIGSVLRDMGEHQAALEKYEEALAIRRQALPAGHPDIAISLGNIGGVLHDMGEHQAALEKYEEALAILRQAFPAGHPHITTILQAIEKTKQHE